MENTLKLLRVAFHVIIFFVALTLLYKMFQQLDSLVYKSINYVARDNLLFEATPLNTDPYITKGDLISLLMYDLEYDMEVVDASGTYTIISKDYNPGNIGQYSLISEKFLKSYSYHLNGNISKIIFKYISE